MHSVGFHLVAAKVRFPYPLRDLSKERDQLYLSKAGRILLVLAPTFYDSNDDILFEVRLAIGFFYLLKYAGEQLGVSDSIQD